LRILTLVCQNCETTSEFAEIELHLVATNYSHADAIYGDTAYSSHDEINFLGKSCIGYAEINLILFLNTFFTQKKL
jgi:hypothetical protein